MIIIDKPYISDFLKETIIKNNYQVLDTPEARELLRNNDINFISKDTLVEKYLNNEIKRIYTTSENSIDWIYTNLPSSNLSKQIRSLKDKTKFREILSEMYPDFYFKEINYREIDNLDVTQIPLPFIIKPSIGFFSMGVYRVDSYSKWENIKSKLKSEISESKDLYPEKVINTSKLIIEEYIDGDEFAFDAYFDNNSNPEILSIFKHIFSGDDDVADRIYFTSKEVIENNISEFTNFLEQLCKHTQFTNFPLHAEIRISPKHGIIPIEINPLRFGGWCTTADANSITHGFNQYEYFINNLKPDWKNILKNRNDIKTSMVVLNNSTGYNSNQIKSFDYEKLVSRLSKVLEIRKVDFNKYPLFGFLFIETDRDSEDEIEFLLNSDLKEFISLK